MNFDWKKEIVTLVYVKQVMSELDKDHIWQYHFPEVAATEEEIENVEEKLGFNLDQKYSDFLRHCNGWRCFYQSIDLFGTNQFFNGDVAQAAGLMLGALDDNALSASGLNRDDLLPIGMSLLDSDLFLMGKPHSKGPGEVYWFAGQEVERYTDFQEFFLTFVDYNRAEVEDLEKET